MAPSSPKPQIGPPSSVISAGGNRKKSFFAHYAKLFRQATGLELNLLQSRAQKVAVLWGATRNPFCRSMLASASLCNPCRESLLQAVAQGGKSRGRVDLHCCAALSVTILPLRTSQLSGLYLLAGRVLAGNVNLRSQTAAMRKLEKMHPSRKAREWVALLHKIEHLPLEKYEAAIGMLVLSLPQLAATIEEDLLAETPAGSVTVSKASTFILENFTENIGLAEVAHSCSLSEDYMSHHFKQNTGRSVSAFITALRVERAATLLFLHPSKTITEICFAAGFQSISQFNRRFRAATGMSPNTFRNSSSAKDHADSPPGNHSICTRTRQN